MTTIINMIGGLLTAYPRGPGQCKPGEFNWDGNGLAMIDIRALRTGYELVDQLKPGDAVRVNNIPLLLLERNYLERGWWVMRDTPDAHYWLMWRLARDTWDHITFWGLWMLEEQSLSKAEYNEINDRLMTEQYG